MSGKCDNISDILMYQKDGKKVCIIYGEQKITYEELLQNSKALLKDFTQEQLGNNVGILLPNSIDYAISYFAILLRGKTIIPIPYYSKSNEIESNIKYCELNTIITDEEGYEKLKTLTIEEAAFSYKIQVLIMPERKVEVINPQGDFLCNKLSDENSDVAIMLHTSGTTSNPKRVMLTHNGLLRNINSNVKSLDLKEDDVCLISLPMCFGYCNTSQFLTHLYIGGSMVILDSIFTAKSFFKCVQTNRITNFTAVPTMLKILDSFSKVDEYDISSLRYLCFGGGNVSVDLIDSISKKLKTVGVVQTYGQTEAGPRVTALLPEDYEARRDSVGKTIPDVEVKIVDDDGVECEEAEIGNIIVKSPAVMKGYYKNEEATRNALINGWLYTGDMGHVIDGFLYLNGRKKNMIICGGLNIYPEEIEEVFQMIEGVQASKVYGIPDDVWGEIPIADIMLVEGYEFEAVKKRLLEIAKQKLSDYKIPKAIHKVDNFERTYTGKIKRR